MKSYLLKGLRMKKGLKESSQVKQACQVPAPSASNQGCRHHYQTDGRERAIDLAVPKNIQRLPCKV